MTNFNYKIIDDKIIFFSKNSFDIELYNLLAFDKELNSYIVPDVKSKVYIAVHKIEDIDEFVQCISNFSNQIEEMNHMKIDINLQNKVMLEILGK